MAETSSGRRGLYAREIIERYYTAYLGTGFLVSDSFPFLDDIIGAQVRAQLQSLVKSSRRKDTPVGPAVVDLEEEGDDRTEEWKGEEEEDGGGGGGRALRDLGKAKGTVCRQKEPTLHSHQLHQIQTASNSLPLVRLSRHNPFPYTSFKLSPERHRESKRRVLESPDYLVNKRLRERLIMHTVVGFLTFSPAKG